MKHRSILFFAAVSLAAGACGKSSGTDQAAPAKTGSGEGSGAGSAASAIGSAAGSATVEASEAKKSSLPKLDCAKLLPQSVVDKYFKDVPTKYDEPSSQFSEFRTDTTCRFVYDEKTNKKILIDYQCGGEFADLDDYLATTQKHLRAKWKRVAGIGRGGFNDGVTTYGAQHRSLPCLVMVDLAFLADNDPLRKKDYMALIRELEAAMPDAP